MVVNIKENKTESVYYDMISKMTMAVITTLNNLFFLGKRKTAHSLILKTKIFDTSGHIERSCTMIVNDFAILLKVVDFLDRNYN